MAVSSFLEEYDFSGKTVIPFCSHEGSGLGSGVSVIRELCPDATILDGYEVRGSRAADEDTAAGIKEWMQKIGQTAELKRENQRQVRHEEPDETETYHRYSDDLYPVWSYGVPIHRGAGP